MSCDRQALGRFGERLARLLYEHGGYEVLERRFRVREGELDLVVRRGPVLVFVEVKTRRGTAWGAPAEAVTRGKLRRMRLVARRYLAQVGSRGASRFRFDVVAVTLAPDGGGLELVLLRGVA